MSDTQNKQYPMKGVINEDNKLKFDDIVVEFYPTILHLLPQGAINEKPSFAMEGVHYYGAGKITIIGQLSLETLKHCLNEVGYKIEKI